MSTSTRLSSYSLVGKVTEDARDYHIAIEWVQKAFLTPAGTYSSLWYCILRILKQGGDWQIQTGWSCCCSMYSIKDCLKSIEIYLQMKLLCQSWCKKAITKNAPLWDELGFPCGK